MGSALACMSAQLSYGNRKFEQYDSKIKELLPQFYDRCQELSQLIDQDALAFNSYVDARKLPGKTESEKLKREEMISKGLLQCVQVPFQVITKAYSLWPYMKELAPIFNIETKSDLLVSVKCLETGIYGAYANVLINLKSFNNNNEEVLLLGLGVITIYILSLFLI
jgi:glutamate formiminotransferase/formiminotetrahydrofolate cyclodeaminase